MPTLKSKLPSYRLHKKSCQGVVTLDGHDYYCGPYDAEESRQRYDQLIAKWLAYGRRMPVNTTDTDTSVSVNELVVAYWDFAQEYYRKPDGSPTTAISNIRVALRPLVALFGDDDVASFGPKNLKVVQQFLIEQDHCRKHINSQVSQIKRVFKWGTSEEMVPGPVYQALQSVGGLRVGRSAARESEPVKPVAMVLVDAIKPHVSRQVWAMVQVQLHSGARPNEIVNLRLGEIDQSGEVWSCELDQHKTSHHGHRRILHFGPKAQAALESFVKDRSEDAYLFSPIEAELERRRIRHSERVTPMSCGNRPGSNRKKKPKVVGRPCYDVSSYGRAITRGCDAAYPPPEKLKRLRVDGIKAQRWETDAEWKARLGEKGCEKLKAWQRQHHWHPNQLRHTAATKIRKDFGIDAARAVLGHRSPVITEVYAELDAAQAIDVIAKVG